METVDYDPTLAEGIYSAGEAASDAICSAQVKIQLYGTEVDDLID